MDSLLQTYPPFSSSSQESNTSNNANDVYHERQAAAQTFSTNGDGPCEQTQNADPSATASQPLSSDPQRCSQTQFPDPQPHFHPPTPAAHPHETHFSNGSDRFAAFGAVAPEAISETKTFESGLRELGAAQASQAQEGSQRLSDGMDSEAPKVNEGDAVSYAWGGGRPEGTVTEVETQGAVTMVTKRGNEVEKHGEPENPALYIDRGPDHDVVKKASEVSIEEKANSSAPAEPEKKPETEEKKDEPPKPAQPLPSMQTLQPTQPAQPTEEKKQENGEPQTGDKRSAEEPAEEKKAEEPNGEAKKQKTDNKPTENGEPPKKKGRPAKTDADGNPIAQKETKKRPPKKAATESGEPRRSGRVAGKSS